MRPAGAAVPVRTGEADAQRPGGHQLCCGRSGDKPCGKGRQEGHGGPRGSTGRRRKERVETRADGRVKRSGCINFSAVIKLCGHELKISGQGKFASLGSVPGVDSLPGLVSLDVDDFSCFRCSWFGKCSWYG